LGFTKNNNLTKELRAGPISSNNFKEGVSSTTILSSISASRRPRRKNFNIIADRPVTFLRDYNLSSYNNFLKLFFSKNALSYLDLYKSRSLNFSQDESSFYLLFFGFNGRKLD